MAADDGLPTAVTYLQQRNDVDSDRIGAWGTSYSGGHVIILGAIDKRVKAISSQVPVVSGYSAIQRLVRQTCSRTSARRGRTGPPVRRAETRHGPGH